MMRTMLVHVITVVALLGMTVVRTDAEASVRLLALDWSFNGTSVFVARSDGKITQIDAQTMQPVSEFGHHTATVRELKVSPDGQALAAGTEDGFVTVWRIPDGTLINSVLAVAYSVSAVDWFNDGQRIAACGVGDSICTIVNVRTGERLFQFNASSLDVAISPNERYWAYALSNGGGIVVRQTDTGEIVTVLGEETAPIQLAWTPDSTHIFALATSANDVFNDDTRTYRGRLWNMATAQAEYILPPLTVNRSTTPFAEWEPFPRWEMQFSPDGSQMFNINPTPETSVTYWDVRTGALSEIISVPFPPQSIVAWSPYHGRIAVIDPTRSIVDVNPVASLQIIVPDASIDRLNAIAELCVRDSSRPALTAPLTDQPITEAALPAFVAQIESLPADAIPPACRADLLAVAEAFRSQP